MTVCPSEESLEDAADPAEGTFALASQVDLSLIGTRIVVLPAGKREWKKKGTLLLRGERLVLKKWSSEEPILDLGQVESLGHKGARLLVHTPGTSFEIIFKEPGLDAEEAKKAFAALAGKPLPEKKKSRWSFLGLE
mgnify:FL=1